MCVDGWVGSVVCVCVWIIFECVFGINGVNLIG